MAEEEAKQTEQVETEPEKVKEGGLTPRQIFWIRFVLYVLFGLGLPCAFIIWRCDIFKGTTATLGFWGVLLVILVSTFAASCLRWVKKSLTFSIWKQIIDGFLRVIIPLTTILLCVVVIKNNIDLVIQVLGCIIACEVVAIPVNPLPQWYMEQNNEEMGSVMDMAINKYFTRKSEEDAKKKAAKK